MPRTPNPAKPYSRYRPRGRAAAIVLPLAGRTERVPPMPKGARWTTEHRALWRELWRSPQATQWRPANAIAVGMFVAYSVAVMDGSAAAWQARECRQMAHALGLTPTGMAALGWRLEEPEEAEERAERRSQSRSPSSRARDRLRVVDTSSVLDALRE